MSMSVYLGSFLSKKNINECINIFRSHLEIAGSHFQFIQFRQ